jgi:hypothetical protein
VREADDAGHHLVGHLDGRLDRAAEARDVGAPFVTEIEATRVAAS